MVVRLHNLGKWLLLAPGASFVVQGLGAHQVTVDVNCEQRTPFVVVRNDGSQTFIASVEGMERLIFTAEPDEYLMATSDGAVWFFSNEGDQIAVESFEQSFTRLATRRERNPELELMMWKQNQNMLRRETQMAEQMAEFRADMAARAAAEGANPVTGEIVDEHPIADDPAAAGDPGEGIQVAAVSAAATQAKGVKRAAVRTA